MGKKLIEKLIRCIPSSSAVAQQTATTPRCSKNWGDWRDFASYAFNKTHATCYSWVAYQTAYLKANYPAQYMAAC